MIGIYVLALTVAVIYAVIMCAATYRVPESTSAESVVTKAGAV